MGIYIRILDVKDVILSHIFFKVLIQLVGHKRRLIFFYVRLVEGKKINLQRTFKERSLKGMCLLGLLLTCRFNALMPLINHLPMLTHSTNNGQNYVL